MSKLVKVRLHGRLGEEVGAEWNLAVESVGEAMRAINVNTQEKLNKFFYEKDKEGFRYRVLVNEKPVALEEGVVADTIEKIDLEKITQSELTIKRSLESIDIVPIIEGSGGKAGGIIAAVLGVVLIVIGAILIATPFGFPLIMGGLGLVAAGVMVLLSKPPRFDDFRESDGYGRKKVSYLFDGPVNTTREGGPVPIGYGRLLIGSQVIQTDYVVRYVKSTEYNTTKNINI